MQIYTCKHSKGVAVAVSYGRGHAVKMIAKALEAQGLELTKQDKVEELSFEDTKGYVRLFLQDNTSKTDPNIPNIPE
jgi:hypothetical protein